MNDRAAGEEAVAGEGTRPAASSFEILKIYTKDVSFETPNSPAIFRVEWQPNVDLHLHSESTKIAPGQFEVVLTVTVTVSIGEQTAFLAEVHMGGIFAITGLISEEIEPVLGSACPAILYPYAREVVSDLTTRGGFPQCILAPVNFEALYLHHRRQQEAAQAPAEDA